MKHSFLFFWMLPVLVLSCTEARSYDTTAHSLLWRVTSPSGAASYVFGTIHLRDSAIFHQRDTLMSTLRSARMLYTEIDLDSAKLGGFDPSRFMNPAGKQLKDYYTAAEYAVIKKAISEKLGAMAAMADLLKPSAIMILLAMDSFEQNTTMGMDEFLWSYAGKAKVARRGVERVEEQTSLLDSMPPSLLLDYVQDMGHQDSLGPALLHAYETEDLGAVGQLMKEMDDWGEFGKALNDNRNARMVARLSKEFQKGGIVLAVGALHLPGENGILARLERAGYQVVPVLGGRRTLILSTK